MILYFATLTLVLSLIYCGTEQRT